MEGTLNDTKNKLPNEIKAELKIDWEKGEYYKSMITKYQAYDLLFYDIYSLSEEGNWNPSMVHKSQHYDDHS